MDMFETDTRGPRLTTEALRRWLPPLVRRSPDLMSAYVIPGRVAPRLREATMLGVTSVNRCRACARVHERWARAAGLGIDDPADRTPDEVEAWEYGRALAVGEPERIGPPPSLSTRHRRELEAAGIAMQLANLAGNRFLPARGRFLPARGRFLTARGRFLPARGSDRRGAVVEAWAARLYDVAMQAADRVGLRRARERIVAGATGDVLEIGIGTGLNLAAYPAGTSLQAIDPSEAALAVAAQRAERLGRRVVLTAGDAAALPYPDDSFDVVLGTFVLCTVGDVAATLHECRRVLRPGGTLRVLEHTRSNHPAIARAQTQLAPAWSQVAGGCRLDHDLRSAVEAAGLRITEHRSRAGGLLVEIVAIPA